MNCKTRRSFVHWNESWQRDHDKGIEDEIVLGVDSLREGGVWVTEWTWAIRWYDIHNDPVIRVEVFEGSFQAFCAFADVFTDLAARDYDNQGLRAEYVCEVLRDLGIVDATVRKRPKNAPHPECPTCHRMLDPKEED